MFSELLFLIGAIALAHTATSPQLSVCSIQSEVKNGDVLEKNLCFVNRKLTAFKAKNSCETFGMSLYQPQSSAGSRAALVSFGKTVLGGSRKAAVYVGTRSGNRCQTATGTGSLNSVSCSLTLSFLCEFQSSTPAIIADPHPCGSVNVPGVDYFVTYGYSEVDAQCDYFIPIMKKTESLFSSSVQIQKENIKAITLYNNPSVSAGSMYLPIELAKNFPNLAVLFASTNQIVEVTKENLQGLVNLQLLNLSFNQISALLSDAFAEVPNLKRLTVDNNPLTTISGDLFSVTLRNLNSLDIFSAGCIDVNDLDQNDIRLMPQIAADNTCSIV